MDSEFVLYILTALSLVFVIEGFLYAVFPDLVRKVMAVAIMMPVEKLRYFGLIMMGIGVLSVYFLQM